MLKVPPVLKERRAFRGSEAAMAATVNLETPDHEDFLDTLVEMEPEVLLVPLDPPVTLDRWGCQAVKVTKAASDLVGFLVQKVNQDQMDLKVLKENRAHLDQDLRDVQESRVTQVVQEFQV